MKVVEGSDLVKFENNILVINLTVKGKLDFKLIASTDSKVTATIFYQVEIIQSDPYDAFLLDRVNTFPKFEKELPQGIDISLVEELDGSLEDEAVFEYKTPKLIDAENNGIILEVDRGGQSFINSKQNEDDTLSILIDKSTVPRKDASYPVSIRVGDSLGQFSNRLERINIKVSFKSKIAEAEQQAKEKAEEEEKLKQPKSVAAGES